MAARDPRRTGARRSERPRWLATLLAACLAILPAISACPRPCACPGPAELHCTFRYFSAVPPRIPRDVQRINLGYNSLRTLSPADFAGLEKLELLLLHSNEINAIPDKVFGDLRSLQVLKMSYNKVRVLQQDAFYGLSSLARLHMDHNQIEFVYPNVFYGLTSLRLVHLDGNLLQQLHPDTFVTLHYSQIFKISFLKHISLADNALTSLPQEMFSYMPELESIYLHGNPWSCDCSLQGFAEWAQERPDVLKCRKERGSGAQQCPVCASPKNHNGKSLVGLPSASLTCFKPVIHDSLKSRNLTLPDDGDFGFVSPRDFLAPIGSVVLNMTDQAGNRGNLVCHVQKPEETSPVSFAQEGGSAVLKTSFSAFLECGVDRGRIQQLWGILALYSASPLKLQRSAQTAAAPFGSYKYRQIRTDEDELFTGVEAELRADPDWLMQSQVSLRLDRTATTLGTLRIRYASEARLRLPGEGTARVAKDWAIVSRDASSHREHTVLVGGSVELDCRAAGRPAPATEWILADGSRVRAPHVSEDGRVAVLSGGTLTLRSADAFDTGLYHCIGTNGRDADSLAFRVTVLEPRVERRAVNGARLWAAPGSTLHLPCASTAAPDAAVSWVLPELAVLRSSAGNKRLFANGTLSIRGVREQDAGFFRCVAANQYGADLLVFQVLVRRDGTAPREKHGAAGQGEEGSGGAGLSAGPSAAPAALRAHGQSAASGAQRARQSNGRGKTRRRPYSDGTGRRLGGRRRQLASSGRRADPQRWAAWLEKTRRNRTATGEGGDAAAEPPVQVPEISEVTEEEEEEEEETSGALAPPEEFVIPATERSPVLALGRATELTTAAGAEEPTKHNPGAGKTPLPLTETSTPLPSLPPHSAAPDGGKPPTHPTPTGWWEGSDGSRVPANGVKAAAVTSGASATATLSPAARSSARSGEGNNRHLKSASATPTTRVTASTSEAGTPQNAADKSRVFTEADAKASAAAERQVPAVTVTTPSPESGPVYFHSARRGGSPEPPLASSVASPQQIPVSRDVPTRPPQLQQRHGRPRKVSGPRRIVRPGQGAPSVKEPRSSFGRPGSAGGGAAVAAGAQGNANCAPNAPALNTFGGSLDPLSPGAAQPSPSAVNTPLEQPVAAHPTAGAPRGYPSKHSLGAEENKPSSGPKAAATAKGAAATAAGGWGVTASPPALTPLIAPLTDTRASKTKTLGGGGRRGRRRKRPPKTPAPQRATAATAAGTTATPPVTAVTPPAVPPNPTPAEAPPGSVGAVSVTKAPALRFPDTLGAPQPGSPAAARALVTQRSIQTATSLPGGPAAHSPGPVQPRGTQPPTSPAASPAQTPTWALQSSRRLDEPPGATSGPAPAQQVGGGFSGAAAAAGERSLPKPGQGAVPEQRTAGPATTAPGVPVTVTAPSTRHPSPLPAPSAAVPPSEGTARDSTLTARTPTALLPPPSASPRGRDKDSSGQGGSERTQRDREPTPGITTTTPNPITLGSASRNHFSKPSIVGGKLAAFTLQANSDAFIPCQATGNPLPVIEWTKIPSGSDAPGRRGAGRGLVLANGTLSIPRAGPEDSGRYLCTAANALGVARLLVTLSVLAYPARIAGGRQRLLTAHSGSSVAVACRAEGRPPPSISWLLANGTRLSRSSSTASRKARVEADGTLVIRALSVYDRGLYACLAQNAAGSDTLAVRLQVVAAPPTILEEKRQSVAGTAGESLDLPCTAQGKPEPSVHWVLPDGTVLKALRPLRAGRFLFSNGTFRLGSIAPADSGTYECIATSSTGSDRRVVSLVVEPRDAPPKIAAASPEPTRLNFGERLLLNCTASGEPRPRIIWRLPSRALVDQWHRMGSRIRVYPNGSLAIEAVTEKDAGDYLCVARNRIGDDLLLLRVSVATKPAEIDRKQQLEQVVPYGGDFRVDCEASGSPAPQISWALPDGTVLSKAMPAEDSGRGSRRYVLFDNGTLYLDGAGLAEAGDYTCYAQNSLGRDEMKIHVTVAVAAPQIKHKHEAHFTVKAGDTALLDCEAAGEPRPQISWLLPSGQTVSASTGRHSLHAGGSLSISPAEPPDAGRYACVARNPGGADTKLYELDVAARPPTINGVYGAKGVTKVTAVRHSKKHIDCRAEGTPPPQITWITPDNVLLTAPYYGSRIAVHTNGTLEIRNVRPSDGADFICVARNDGGETVLVVQLEVVEMLRRPVFRNPSNERVVAKPGRAVTLDCSADGNPPPDVSWMLPNGTWFSSSLRTPELSTGSDGTLTIQGAGRRHAGRYRCAARNRVGYIEKMTLLEVAREPRILSRPAGPLKAVSGEPLSLHCPAEGSPEPRVAWTLPGGQVLERPQVRGRFALLENGTLVVRAASALDAGTYECSARNDAGTSSLAVAVEVTALAPRIVGRAPPAVRTAAGAAVQLRCVALGIPKPEIAWRLPDGSALSTARRGPAGELLHPAGTLLLRNPRPSDSGAYECTARSPLGTDTAVTYLRVL